MDKNETFLKRTMSVPLIGHDHMAIRELGYILQCLYSAQFHYVVIVIIELLDQCTQLGSS